MHKGNTALVLVATLALVAIAVSGYTLYKSRTPAPSPSVSVGTSTPTPTATPKAQVTVVWQPSGSFSAEDKATLQTRVVNPFVDYYAQANMGKLLTLTISINDKGTQATYPFLGEGIFEGGGTVGFVIEKPIKWWAPECMGQCPLTAEFKAKYPEIVAILGY